METKIDREDAKFCIDAIKMGMEDLVEHRKELQVIAQFDKNLAAKMVGVFDAADEVLEYIDARSR